MQQNVFSRFPALIAESISNIVGCLQSVLPTGIYTQYIANWYIYTVSSAWYINFDLVYMKNLVYIWYTLLEGLIKTVNQNIWYFAKRKFSLLFIKKHCGVFAFA